jgi:hypothetical protein
MKRAVSAWLFYDRSGFRYVGKSNLSCSDALLIDDARSQKKFFEGLTTRV